MSTFNIGFTGSREGMTQIQREVFTSLLSELVECQIWPVRFHHGCCKGADEEAHIAAINLGIDVHIHPPRNISAMAKLTGEKVRYPAAEYLTRNRNIVSACEMIIAAPKEEKEILRSGTWATIRYAREEGITLFIINPDGEIIISGPGIF